ncbi:MAG TPA: SDR family NAD(P)-dependent oxidoreductase [Solirubrobacteraceae bacterium]|jgi:NAD(P)-dependent dehydrogenase (short-subunit alcohol dehydrogenase family)|nr:SDR family NAD(P)-dependent oxidoreductase [Solirubrobacteraceae bacterium]
MGTVFVTGAARGIGRATVARLAAGGWDVVAGVRRAEDAEAVTALDPARIRAVTVELTDPSAIAGLDSVLPARLDAIVNNAGIVVGGPVEAVPAAELRRQLEVNVVAQAAVTQAVLGRLRASRGRIVFVSSLSGRISTPMTGAYNASKFALEGMADALRMELAPWGIKVVLVEPAQTDTDMWRQAQDELDATVAALSDEYRQLYAAHIEGFRKSIPRSQKMATSVEGAAATIERALTARRPRARYVVGRSAQIQAAMARLTPTPVLDLVLRVGTGVPWRARRS